MKKLIFEDTTVIKKPFVEIDGVEYEVQDGEFEGGTDLNAENFNQVQDNIEDYIDGETSMGSIIVEDIECKNKFNINGEIKTSTSTSYSVSGNTITVTGLWFAHQVIKVKPNTDYYVSFNITTTTGKIGIYDEKVSKVIHSYETSSFSFNSGENNKVTIVINTDSNGSTSKTISVENIQIEKGIVATNYIAYKEFSNKQIYSSNEQVIGTWLGVTLYRKVINIGAIPNKTTKTIGSGLTNESVVKIYGIAKNSDGYCLPLPYTNSVSQNDIRVTYSGTHHTIEVITTSDMSAYSGYVVIEYTKKDTNAVAEQTNQTTTSTTSTTNNENLELTDM
jgi:hypothetical protein